jgi:hypothetical protein
MIKVLTISVDVTNLSPQEIEDLQVAMEAQTEDYDSSILNSAVNDIDEEELLSEDEDATAANNRHRH